MALNYLFNLALTPLFTSLQSAVSSSDNAIAILLTIQIIILIIIGLITSIVSWFFFILMINYTVSLVRESNYSAMSHFKDGFRGIRNGHKTWFKFFIAVLLINLIIIIITQPLGTILSVTTGNMSQKSCYSHSVCSTSNYCCITINPLFCSYDGCSSVLLKTW